MSRADLTTEQLAELRKYEGGRPLYSSARPNANLIHRNLLTLAPTSGPGYYRITEYGTDLLEAHQARPGGATRVVWKYVVPLPGADGYTTVMLPSSAAVLSLVAAPTGELVVYALVDPATADSWPLAECTLLLANTGMAISELPPTARWLGTVLVGAIVWHGWEVL